MAKSGLQDRLLHPVGQLVTYTKHWWVAMSKHLPVTVPLVASHWCCSLLAKSTNHQAFPWTSLCQRYQKLPSETVATEQRWPASQLPILQYWSYSCAHGHYCACVITKAWLQQEINSLLHTPGHAISDLHALGLRAAQAQGCNNIYMYIQWVGCPASSLLPLL